MVGYAQHHVPTPNLVSGPGVVEFAVAGVITKICTGGSGYVAYTRIVPGDLFKVSTSGTQAWGNSTPSNASAINYDPISDRFLVSCPSSTYMFEVTGLNGAAVRNYGISSGYTAANSNVTYNSGGSAYGYQPFSNNFGAGDYLQYWSSNIALTSNYNSKSIILHTDGYLYTVGAYYSAPWSNYGIINKISISSPSAPTLVSGTVTSATNPTTSTLYGCCSHPTNGLIYITSNRSSAYGTAGGYVDTVYSYNPASIATVLLYTYPSSPLAYPYDIIVGKNGNLFIQEQGGSATNNATNSGITELKIDGTFVRRWVPINGSTYAVTGICVGPDNKVWYACTNGTNSYIGHLPY